MARNKRQHVVSQFAIRQFLGDRTRLFCLNKSTLEILDRTHGNGPDQILTESYYYTSDTEDFDRDVVRPLEDEVAPIIGRFARQPDRRASPSEQDAMLRWCLLSICRSMFFEPAIASLFDNLPSGQLDALPQDRESRVLVARRATFESMHIKWRGVPLASWCCVAASPYDFVVTDHPPMTLPWKRHEGVTPIVLPVSHDVMFFLVPAPLAEEFRGSFRPTRENLCFLQCGWANRLIYSADTRTLDFAKRVLNGESGDVPSDWLRRARQPYFGQLEVRS
jgi:hypothetical protein